MLQACLAAACGTGVKQEDSAAEPFPDIEVRGIYGGIPGEGGEELDLASLGVNAVWIGSGGVTKERVEAVKAQGARIFAEFNTLHVAGYLEEHPDAAPVGPDGKISPPPHDWQGICPTHEGYRSYRMEEFRELAGNFDLDGIWLDYHHSHAAWEREDPVLPDTCFCPRCLAEFSASTGIVLPDQTTARKAAYILEEHREAWIEWRCDLFTDWVREFREILDEERPGALLGTFHNPWSDQDYDGARIEKLAIDLKAQAEYIDVFSPMPYHARFGYADDPQWVARQVSWLGEYLGITGGPGEVIKIWPIVQLADWGREVHPSQVEELLFFGSQPPSTGVMVFSWGRVKDQPEKVAALRRFYTGLSR